MPLHTIHRPESLDDVVGNEGVVESLKSVLLRETDIPHSYLFTGPAGTGKTTCARIIKNELNCSDSDFHLYNSSNTRGIDTVREIIDGSQFSPMLGDTKIVVLEECFAKGTKITTANSIVPIEEIQVGDKIKNIHGIDKVEKVFINKVPLDRVAKVTISNGETIFCSKDHLFLTDFEKREEWTRAKNLDKECYLYYACDNMQSNNTQEVHKNAHITMSRMQKRISDEKEKPTILFEPLCSSVSNERESSTVQKSLFSLWKEFYCESTECQKLRKMQNDAINDLRRMWFGILRYSCGKFKVLFPNMCWEMEKYATGISKITPFGGKKEKIKSSKKSIYGEQSEKICRNLQRPFGKNENRQSISQSKDFGKDKSYEKSKWDFTCMAHSSWWKWGIYKIADTVNACFGMETGSCYSNSTACALWPKGQILQETRIPSRIQSGFGEYKIEDGDRNRRYSSQLEVKKERRQKEREEIKRIRVESVEIYKRGNNDRSFEGVIGDKERNQGFVNFYDFQVEKHPSYIANGCMVHNCHQLTGPAQEALLVILEEPPDYLYFILCTTEPDKLKKSLKRRCHISEMKSLALPQIKKLLKDTLSKEGFNDFPKKITDKIAEVCDGSPGKALNLLDTIIDIADSDVALKAIEDATVSESNIAEIARVLLSGRGQWKDIATMIKGLTGEPESLRYAFLGYFNAVLLNKGSANVAALMMPFMEPCMYTGKAGLTFAIYMAWSESKQ